MNDANKSTTKKNSKNGKQNAVRSDSLWLPVEECNMARVPYVIRKPAPIGNQISKDQRSFFNCRIGFVAEAHHSTEAHHFTVENNRMLLLYYRKAALNPVAYKQI